MDAAAYQAVLAIFPAMQIDLSAKDAWDDTELIRAYDRAIASYKASRRPSCAHRPCGDGSSPRP